MGARRRHAAAGIAAITAWGVLAGAGGAAAAAVVTGRQVKDGTVASADVRNGTLRSRDLRDGGVASADLADGELGQQDLSPTALAGLAGAPGPAGPLGQPGRSGYQVVRNTVPVPSGFDGFARVVCPGNLRAISVHAFWDRKDLGVRTVLDTSSGTARGGNASAATHLLTVGVVCMALSSPPPGESLAGEERR